MPTDLQAGSFVQIY